MKQRPEPVLVAECSDRLPNIHPSRWRLAGGWAGHSSTCCRSGYSDLVKRRTDPVTQQRLSRFCRQLVVSEVRVIDRLTDARNHCHPVTSVSKPSGVSFCRQL